MALTHRCDDAVVHVALGLCGVQPVIKGAAGDNGLERERIASWCWNKICVVIVDEWEGGGGEGGGCLPIGMVRAAGICTRTSHA
jgi:hypothetical protein